MFKEAPVQIKEENSPVDTLRRLEESPRRTCCCSQEVPWSQLLTEVTGSELPVQIFQGAPPEKIEFRILDLSTVFDNGVNI